MIRILTLTILIALTACSPAYYVTPEEAEEATTLVFDNFTKITKITLESGAHPRRHKLIYSKSALTQSESFEVQATYSDRDWIMAKSCYDSNGLDLQCKQDDFDKKIILHPIKGNQLKEIEIYSFPITEPRLREYAEKDGLNFKLIGVRGSAIFPIRPSHITGFLNRVQRFRYSGE